MNIIKLTISIFLFVNFNLYSQSYEYIPKGCEYSVTFMGIPELIDSYVPLPDGEIYNYIIAQYINENESSFQKAESIPFINSSLTENETKSELLQIINNYAESNGLSNYEIGFEKTYLGYVASLRGFKNIKGEKFTFGSKVFCGDNSILVIMFGSLSKDYPTNGITDFVYSVKR